MNGMDASPRPMRVMDSLNAAMGRSRDMLFRPFDLKKWLCLGVIIFIEALLGGGGGGGGGRGGGWPGGSEFRPSEAIRAAEAWVLDHLVIVVTLGLAIFAVILTIGLVLAYLGSRGQLMFARAVAKDDAGIGSNWRAAGPRATSLFLFHVVFGLVSGVLFLLVMALAYATSHALAVAGVDDLWAYFLGLVPYIIAMVPMVLVFIVVRILVRNFVVPIMYWHNAPCLRAIGEFRGLMRGNVAALMGFLAMKFLYSIAFGVSALVIGLLTCCIGFLPVVHHALFAPFYVFDRAFSLYLLQSACPEEFRVEEQTPPPSPDAATAAMR